MTEGESSKVMASLMLDRTIYPSLGMTQNWCILILSFGALAPDGRHANNHRQWDIQDQSSLNTLQDGQGLTVFNVRQGLP